jgi:UDP-glucose 4-epimerase
MVVPRFLALALAGQPLPLFGGGGQTRDFVYINDVAEAAILSAKAAESFDILNVSTGIPTSIAALAQLISQASGRCAVTEQPPTPSQRAPVEVSWSVGSTDHMAQRLGFHSKITLAEGLKLCLTSPSPS